MIPSSMRSGLRPGVAAGLAANSARHHPVRSGVTLVIVALAAAVVVATTGRTDAARQSILARLDAPANRIIRVVDRTGTAGMRPAALTRIASVSGVEWSIALGPVGNLARNAGLGDAQTTGNAGEPVGTRLYWGDLGAVAEVRLTVGRLPHAREALAGATARRSLGLAAGFGTVVDDDAGPVGVVGTMHFGPALENLNSYVLIRAGDTSGHVAEIVVLADAASSVEPLVELLPGIIAPDDVTSIGIKRAEALTALRDALAREVTALNAAILLGSLGMAALLVTINLFGAIAERRREFGLRRTQGATRSVIAALVIMEVGGLALLGSLCGVVTGVVLITWQTGLILDPVLSLAIAVLLTLGALAGSVPAALAAAYQEPLYALRAN